MNWREALDGFWPGSGCRDFLRRSGVVLREQRLRHAVRYSSEQQCFWDRCSGYPAHVTPREGRDRGTSDGDVAAGAVIGLLVGAFSIVRVSVRSRSFVGCEIWGRALRHNDVTEAELGREVTAQERERLFVQSMCPNRTAQKPAFTWTGQLLQIDFRASDGVDTAGRA